jgi:hypothetical protein
MSDRFINIISKFSFLCLILSFWLSCGKQKHYEPVIITEELLCELQDIFNGVSLDAGRPCQQYLEIEYYPCSYYGALSNDTVIKDQVLRMKDRYRIKYNREQRTNREWYVEFEKYLAEMEKYGIKCISSRNILKEREHLVIYDDIPCKNYTQIHFYADRNILKCISII